MCGRLVTVPIEQIVEALLPEIVERDLPEPSFNVAPGQSVAIVVDSAREGTVTRRLAAARWGLLPRWAKDSKLGYRTFNAVSEKATRTPSFADAIATRRALIPVAGFYEWDERVDPAAKRPYHFHRADRAPIMLAGLYSWWPDPTFAQDDPARWVLTTTVLTREPLDPVARIHHRTPVMLPPEHWDTWLDPTIRADQAFVDRAAATTPRVASVLDWHEVGKAVGNWRNDTPALVERVGAAV